MIKKVRLEWKKNTHVHVNMIHSLHIRNNTLSFKQVISLILICILFWVIVHLFLVWCKLSGEEQYFVDSDYRYKNKVLNK